MDAALGKTIADLVIKHGSLVNVYTAEVYKVDIAVKENRIIAVNNNLDYLIGDKTQIINAEGKYITPGFIDAHIHIGGTHLTMTRWAEVLLKNGTTSLATDCYDIGVVAGKKGVRFAIDESNTMGLNVLFVVPVVAFMQHNPFGNSNTFNEADMFDMLGWSECVGVNEPPVAWFLEKNPSILKLCEETLKQGKIIVGHGAGTFGEKLTAYLNMGPNSDHECLSAEEAKEKLRLGMQILMREGSAAVDLEHVVKAITEYNMPSENFMFCTDERDPVDFYQVGHLNYTMRKAIACGLNPIKAVQIASINAAKYYRKDHEIGSITPGKLADILILNDLTKVEIDYVISKGEIVVKNGKYIKPVIDVKYPEYMKCKINLKKAIELKDLAIVTDLKKDKVKVRVARCVDGTLVSEKEEATLPVIKGEIKQDSTKDIAKMIVIERHKAKGLIGRAFVSGFGLKKGAFAQTYNPVTDNIIVLGTSDNDILAAIKEVQKIGGGFVVVEDGKRIAELSLPILGILSDKSIEEVQEGFSAILKAIRKLGSTFKSPILSLAFMAMAYGIPTYKLSEYGLVDIDEGKLVDNVIE
jgi:adenine deaminase